MCLLGWVSVMPDKNHTREYTLAAAVDKDTYNDVKNLALETLRTPSQVVNEFILSGLINADGLVMKSTSRKYYARILSNHTSEMLRNVQNFDEFDAVKADFATFCLVIGGKIGQISEHGVGKHSIEDAMQIMSTIKSGDEVLYEECRLIGRKTLKKAQYELIFGTIQTV